MKYLKLIPLALGLARSFEDAVPLPGQGKAKLAAALDAGQAVWDMEEDVRHAWGDPKAFLTALSRALTTAVTLLNATGVFKK